MPNKSSPHGGFISEGTVSHGTLRTEDLLRSFAAELKRLLPFNGAALADEAIGRADDVDAIRSSADPGSEDIYEIADEVLGELVEQLNTIAHREGMYFGTLEGDGSDFGFWRITDDA